MFEKLLLAAAVTFALNLCLSFESRSASSHAQVVEPGSGSLKVTKLAESAHPPAQPWLPNFQGEAH